MRQYRLRLLGTLILATGLSPASQASPPPVSTSLGTSGQAYEPIRSADSGSFEASFQAMQFALEPGVNSRLGFHAEMRSESKLISPSTDKELGLAPIPRNELVFHSFFENGAGGDRSIDLDRAAFRFQAPSVSGLRYGHIWVGRAHPLQESQTSDARISPQTAIGSNWVQNQSDALEPRVSGWVGTGLTLRSEQTGLTWTGAYSPLFLPNFGPRLELSDSNDSHGSRYARLPPQYVRINDVLVPMRFQLSVGQIQEIVLQDQVFTSVGYRRKGLALDWLAWSAPSPTASVDTSGVVRTNDEDLDVLVHAKPHFPREIFTGTRMRLTDLYGEPELQAVFETKSSRWVLSAEVSPLKSVRAGVLQTVMKEQPASPVETVLYGKDLVWLEWKQVFEGSRFSPSLRVETQLTSGKQGSWVRPGLEYLVGVAGNRLFSPKIKLFAYADILTGKDYSYFGTWRSLDVVAAGARFAW